MLFQRGDNSTILWYIKKQHIYMRMKKDSPGQTFEKGAYSDL